MALPYNSVGAGGVLEGTSGGGRIGAFMCGGGWWAQRRLYACRLTKEDVCGFGEASGTMWHKLGVCKLSRKTRDAFNNPALSKGGSEAVWDPL